MPNKFRESIHFKLQTSKQCQWLMTGLSVLAVLACWLADLPIYVQSLLTFTIAFFVLLNHQRRLRLIELSYTSDKGWQVSRDGTDFLTITILKTTVISTLAVFLHYRNEEMGDETVMIANDSLSADDYRHLMVKLKTMEWNQSR